MNQEWINCFNVIYKDELYKNCVSINTFVDVREHVQIIDIEIFYIDENGSIKFMRDKSSEFKFVRK